MKLVIVRKVHDFARNELLLTSDRMKVSFNQKTKPISSKVGEVIWYFESQSKKGVRFKTRPWKRPYLTIKKIPNLLFIKFSKPKAVHIEIFSHYYGQDPPCWSKVVQGEQLVEEVQC